MRSTSNVGDENFGIGDKARIYANIAKIGIIVLIIGIAISVGTRGFCPREKELYGTPKLVDWAFKLTYIGALVYYLGVLLLSYSLLSTALFVRDMHIYLRAALLIALGLILGHTITAGYYLVWVWM